MAKGRKYVIVIADGVADEPIDLLGGVTPLRYAQTPAIDRMARAGRSSLLQTIPAGMSAGSEVAILSILGYDVRQLYDGRAGLEALGMGVKLNEDELVLRCNMVTVKEGKMIDYSAGGITSEEALPLIEMLEEKLGDETIHFHSGLGYRHLLTLRGGSNEINCSAPHNMHGERIEEHYVVACTAKGEATATLLNRLMHESMPLLEHHPINTARVAKGLLPANSVWFWSPSHRPSLPPLRTIIPIEHGAMITGVDLVRGIAHATQLDLLEVEGATGSFDTNFAGKGTAAVEALKQHDLVVVHIEATDEAGHKGDAMLKVKMIEELDRHIIAPLFELAQKDKELVVALLPDHPTPCMKRCHTDKAVPFVLYHHSIEPDQVERYDEEAALKGGEGLLTSDQWIARLFNV